MCYGVTISLTNVCVNPFSKLLGGIDMCFASRLTLLRKSHNLTQKQLAANLNISELAIQHYEAKRRKPAFDILIALADFFDVSLDYLVGRSDYPKRK